GEHGVRRLHQPLPVPPRVPPQPGAGRASRVLHRRSWVPPYEPGSAPRADAIVSEKNGEYSPVMAPGEDTPCAPTDPRPRSGHRRPSGTLLRGLTELPYASA